MRMSELPNHTIADVYMSELGATNPKMATVMDIIEKRIGKASANKKLVDTFAPQLIGAKKGSENYTAIMDCEREKQKSSEKTNKIIDAIVDKLLHEDEDDQKGFFGEIVDRIKARIPTKTK